MSQVPAGYPRELELAPQVDGENVEAAYRRLSSNRFNFINRAQDNSALTIPAIMRPEQFASTTALDTPWQSMGARGVNNLASKLSTTLFPPGLSFFKLDINPFVLAQMTGGDVKAKSEIEQNVSMVERQVSRQIESSGMRATIYESFQHLLITGNGCLYIKDDLSMRFFNLKEFVCARDTAGNIVRLIMVERVAKELLPPEIAGRLDKGENQGLVYTDVQRLPKETADEEAMFRISQECMGQKVPTSMDGIKDAEMRESRLPFIVMRYQQLSGESYGRAMVEDLLGDLAALEGMRQAMVEAAAAAAKLLWLVNPNGITRAKDLSEALNGAFVPGMDEDVVPLTLNKLHDFSFAASQEAELKKDLGTAFLLGQSFTRDAERVTAEEIRMIRSELEATLGGVYSLLAEALQLPLVRRLMAVMERQGKIPTMPEGILEPQIITGVEGLGRGADFQNTNAAVGAITNMIGPEEMNSLIDTRQLALRLLTGAGVDAHGLLRTEEELAELRQQQQAAHAAEVAAGPAINQIGGLLKQQQQAE